MKYAPLLVLAFLAFSTQLTSQIVIEKADKQIKVNVNDLAKLQLPTATSACGIVSSVVKETKFSGGCLGTIERIIAYTDDCDNTGTFTQYITLQDDEPPVFVLQETDPVIFGNSSILTPVPTAQDNSGKQVEMTRTEMVVDGIKMETYTATDLCGNIATLSREIITAKASH